ncbi:DUF559 domain-containing protein [Leucobacter muris]|uniref:DUF559 domain-containing protein n=2 Tax=Leucobacter muris TaxID=1935379 RepID=A0ABX5QJB4_9MICO|nr:DUF559 domain-containing protein [Leucobacter muris]
MLREILASHDGVMRTRTLLESGVSKHRVACAVSAGRLLRIRRGWVASPQADPALVFAARSGLMLSCLTQARRLGIWVREADPGHFAVPRPGAEVRPDGARLHYGKPLIPRDPFTLVDRVENVLGIIAHCQPREDAVAAWDSALNRNLVDRAALERLPLDGTARTVLAQTTPFADSGLESYVRLRLRWLRLRIVWQPWLYGHRVDFLIGERLVLQIDGSHHAGRQRTSDISHDAVLRLRGYSVLRVGYEQVMFRWPEVQTLVMEAVAQGLHLA